MCMIFLMYFILLFHKTINKLRKCIEGWAVNTQPAGNLIKTPELELDLDLDVGELTETPEKLILT